MLKFRDLYDIMKYTETSINQMGLDKDNITCNGMASCVITKEQERMIESYMSLADLDIDFCELDFKGILRRIEKCFDCITDEFKEILGPDLPDPFEQAYNCIGSVYVPIEHISRFFIYERTPHPSVPSATQVYVVTADSLPFAFVPSTPEPIGPVEQYSVSWNRDRSSLVIKADSRDYPEISDAPEGTFNIAMIKAEISAQYISMYGLSEVYACGVLIMTPDVQWEPGHWIDKAVDANPTTYTQTKGIYPEIVGEFVFAAL